MWDLQLCSNFVQYMLYVFCTSVSHFPYRAGGTQAVPPRTSAQRRLNSMNLIFLKDALAMYLQAVPQRCLASWMAII